MNKFTIFGILLFSGGFPPPLSTLLSPSLKLLRSGKPEDQENSGGQAGIAYFENLVVY